MVASPEVDVDTSAFMAFLDRSDTHHALFSRLSALPPKLLTTPLVIAEGVTPGSCGATTERGPCSSCFHLGLEGAVLVLHQH